MPHAITDRLKSLEFGPEQGHGPLQFLPVIGSSEEEPEYRVLDGASADVVRVTEVSPSGSVPHLRVENTLDLMVFIMDGQELLGAKQNRILNTDVLVPPHGKIVIPVSCVERGRWHDVGPQFVPGKSAAYRTRQGKMARVAMSLRQAGVHDADQGAVWDEVDSCISMHRVSSPTAAMSDVYEAREREMSLIRESLEMPADAVGLVTFSHGRFMGLDLFDRSSTFHHYWRSIVDSYAVDLVSDRASRSSACESTCLTDDTRALLDKMTVGEWAAFESPGEGSDNRLEMAEIAGSALTWDDRVAVHLQAFPVQRGVRIHRRRGI